MKKIQLILLLILLSCLLPLSGYSQCRTDTTLSSPASGGVITSCNSIQLKPGFSFTANSTQSLTLKVDQSLCAPTLSKPPVEKELPPATTSQNYIQTRTYTNDAGTTYLDSYQYLDGLGRLVETVQQGITPAKADLVTFQEYDSVGRESKTWLPAVASGNNGAFVDPATFSAKSSGTYNNTTYNAAADARPYAYPVYEASPLNRVLQQFGPGADWQNNNKSVATSYQTNSGTLGALSCALFTVTGTGVNIKVTRNNYYADAQLYVTQTTDENGNASYEFKDKLGQVVLTRQMLNGVGLDTYCVYDDFGNPCFVLPPLASSALANGTYDETNATVNQYAYIYKYDNRNRCIAKKLPGCQWIYYLYDSADRLIFTQNGENRKAGIWQFSIPDALGRTVLTGTCNNSYTYSANPLGTVAVKGTYNTSRTNLANSYTVSGITLSNPVILTANFYDDYSFMGIPEIPDNTDTQYNKESGYDTRYTTSYKGMLTGKISAILNPDGTVSTTTYLYSIMYYDNRDRLIQTKSNILIDGLPENGLEKEYIAYNFTGQPTGKKLVHSFTFLDTQTEVYVYTYDHAERLTKETHQLNGGTVTTIAENTYDELGRLKTNKKGGQANLNSTYAYNIRSWTKSITCPLFAETLYYNESYGGSAKQYNGNISAMSWKLSDETMIRGYDFSYNSLSWLTAADYLENGTANANYKTSYSYDNQGDVKTLLRYGLTDAATYGPIDNLTLDYEGNQLTKVEDTAPDILISVSADFKNYSNTTTEYAYNANGSMTSDLNKGIKDIQYNLLNLPQAINIENPMIRANDKYTYSADGKKLQVSCEWDWRYEALLGGVLVSYGIDGAGSMIYYVGNMIYEKYGNKGLLLGRVGDVEPQMIYGNYELKRILIDGGYIEGGVYHYYLTDHQGNNRMVVNAGDSVVQKNHYYPFGMNFADGLSPDSQPYKYNSKELDQMSGLNWYDYLSRFYDPAVARFTTVDPLAEKYYSISPYAYCGNNPVRFVDSDGRQAVLPLPIPPPSVTQTPSISPSDIKNAVQDIKNTVSFIWSYAKETVANPQVINTPYGGPIIVPATASSREGLNNQRKNDRDAKEKLDQNQANVQQTVVTGGHNPQDPGGDFNPNNPKPSTVLKIVAGATAVGLGLEQITGDDDSQGKQQQAQQPQQQQQDPSIWERIKNFFNW